MYSIDFSCNAVSPCGESSIPELFGQAPGALAEQHAVDAGASGSQRTIVANIAAKHFDALGAKLRIIAPPETAHTVAAGQQRFNDIPAKKPAAKKPAAKATSGEDEEGAYGMTEEYLGPRCPNCANAMEEGDIVCLHCGSAIFPPSIGKSGGCNPIPLAAAESNGELVVARADLERGAALFE